MITRWLTMGRLGVLLVLGLGCGRRSSPAVQPERPSGSSHDSTPGAGLASESKRSDAELQALDQCSAAMMSIVERPASERAQALADGWGGVAQCGQLFLARCEKSVEPADDGIARTQATIDACLARYCPQWSGDARPPLCGEGASAFLESSNAKAAHDRAAGFIAAMLATDYGRPPHDATIVRVADRFATLWVAPVMAVSVTPPPMSDEPAADPLDLHFEISAKHGFVLSGQGIEPIELSKGDLDGLRREAEALKRSHPDARTVVITADEDTQMQELLQAMGVLQGDCSAGQSDPKCLFPRVALQVE